MVYGCCCRWYCLCWGQNVDASDMTTDGPWCWFELESTKSAGENLAKLVNKTSTVFIYLKLNFTNAEFEDDRFQYLQNTTDVINAQYWVWARGSHGRFLLEAPFDFVTISLGTLSYGVEESKTIDITILPEDNTDCFIRDLDDSQRIAAIAELLLNLTSTGHQGQRSLHGHFPPHVCLERHKMDNRSVGGTHDSLQSSTFYDCRRAGHPSVESVIVKKDNWGTLLAYIGFGISLYMPAILLVMFLWKKPPQEKWKTLSDDNLQTPTGRANGTKRMALNTDLIPIGLFYTIYYAEFQKYSTGLKILKRVLVLLTIIFLLVLIAFLPFLPRVISNSFFPNQFYDSRLTALATESSVDLTTSQTIINNSIYWSCLSAVLLCLYIGEYHYVNSKLYQYNFLCFWKSKCKNPASLNFLFCGCCQGMEIAYFNPRAFWKGVIKHSYIIGRMKCCVDNVKNLCTSLSLKEPFVSLWSMLKAVFVFLTLVLIFAFALCYWTMLWLFMAFPIVTCILKPLPLPKSRDSKFISRIMHGLRFGFSYLIALYTASFTGLVLCTWDIIYLSKIVGYTFIGMIVNASTVLPYFSAVLSACAIILHQTYKLYDDYHQLYKTIFELAQEIQDKNDFPAHVVEEDVDDGTLTIEVDLFSKIVKHYKPVVKTYSLHIVPIIPLVLVAVMLWKVLDAIDSLDQLFTTLDLFSVYFVTGSVTAFVYLFKASTASECEKMTLKAKIKQDLIWYCKHKQRTITIGYEKHTKESDTTFRNLKDKEIDVMYITMIPHSGMRTDSDDNSNPSENSPNRERGSLADPNNPQRPGYESVQMDDSESIGASRV